MATRLKTKQDVMQFHDVIDHTNQVQQAMEHWAKLQTKRYLTWCAKNQKEPFDFDGNWESFTGDNEEVGH